MIKILFVCHGNICRSPMAEFILKDMIKKQNLSHKYEIHSAATSCEELGNPVYPPAKKILARNGISCEGKRARRITTSDFKYFDYIIGMDRYNLKNIERIMPEGSTCKTGLLMDFTDTPGDVADPWYTDDFEKTFRDILKGCISFLEFLI